MGKRANSSPERHFSDHEATTHNIKMMSIAHIFSEGRYVIQVILGYLDLSELLMGVISDVCRN